MINNYEELKTFLTYVLPYDWNSSNLEKQMSSRATNALRRYVLCGIKYPIADKKVLDQMLDGFSIEKCRGIGRKTVEYIVTKTREYLDSLALAERMTIDEEDKSFENAKISGAFKAGDVALYKWTNGEHYELGVVKKPCDDGSGDCFVWYHQGDTASRTPYSCLRKIDNLYAFDIRRLRVGEELTIPSEPAEEADHDD